MAYNPLADFINDIMAMSGELYYARYKVTRGLLPLSLMHHDTALGAIS